MYINCNIKLRIYKPLLEVPARAFFDDKINNTLEIKFPQAVTTLEIKFPQAG